MRVPLAECQLSPSQKTGVIPPPFPVPSPSPSSLPRLHPPVTCAKLSKDLHGLIKTLLAEEVEGIQVLDMMDLLLLFAVGIIFHFLIRVEQVRAHSLDKYLFSTYYLLNNIPGGTDASVYRQPPGICPQTAFPL